MPREYKNMKYKITFGKDTNRKIRKTKFMHLWQFERLQNWFGKCKYR